VLVNEKHREEAMSCYQDRLCGKIGIVHACLPGGQCLLRVEKVKNLEQRCPQDSLIYLQKCIEWRNNAGSLSMEAAGASEENFHHIVANHADLYFLGFFFLAVSVSICQLL